METKTVLKIWISVNINYMLHFEKLNLPPSFVVRNDVLTNILNIKRRFLLELEVENF